MTQLTPNAQRAWDYINNNQDLPTELIAVRLGITVAEARSIILAWSYGLDEEFQERYDKAKEED